MVEYCIMCGAPLAAEGTWTCPACTHNPLRLVKVPTKLKTILTNKSCNIMYRCNSPASQEEDMLYGYCEWTGEELISSDGDNYSVEDEIEKWEWEDDDLIVWIEVEWI